MTPIVLTSAQVRQILLLKHGLINDHEYVGKAGVLAFLRQAGCLQFDPIDICGRNADLVLFSRVKDYQKSMLEELLYQNRLLVDQWDKVMSIYPVTDWPMMARVRQENVAEYEKNLVPYQTEINHVLERLGQEACLNASTLDLGEPVHFFTWRHRNLGRAILDYLFFKGETIIHHRDGVKRYFALARRHLDTTILDRSDPFQSESEFHKFQLKRRIAAVGLLPGGPSDAYNGLTFKTPERQKLLKELVDSHELIEVRLEGDKDTYYMDEKDLKLLDVPIVNKRLEFIAPLDNFIWDRRLIKRVFGFEYRWEIYHVPEKRHYAPYAMPILYGTDFVGQIELAVDKKKRALILKHLWLLDQDGLRHIKADLRKQLRRFQKFSACDTFIDLTDSI